ncbi:Hypothetical protein, predicted lipoprotein [Metamycoplasma auris 15026]|uniref:Uncharacterized protein n=1 Tax=Metamycoplasma auris 15026 TaxID=1188233 RepID=N9TRS2_9BACT|nr:variable surface lipoprotein [Metamycoplasma auris]ENY68864.1 Hypothetical protein, predicted lipoprotein [Metamycoplasma auris 15026]
MKKINKFLLALGTIASLASMPLIAANCNGTKKEETKKPNEKDPNNKTPENQTSGNKAKVKLNALENSVAEKIKKAIKNNTIEPEEVLDVLKGVKGLESLRLGDFKSFEFKDSKLTIEAIADSSLIEGKLELTLANGKEEKNKKPTVTATASVVVSVVNKPGTAIQNDKFEIGTPSGDVYSDESGERTTSDREDSLRDWINKNKKKIKVQ